MKCINQEVGGCFGNIPVLTDGTASSPSSSTVTLTVPRSAISFVAKNRSGSTNNVDVSIVGKTGSFLLKPAEREVFDVFGLGEPGWPSQITLTLGAATNCDWYFNCRTVNGA